MNWKLSPALVTLRRQYNDLYPNRSKLSDGTVGDLAHQKTPSDHNPDKNGIVKAFDLTHDPAHGVDCNKESEKVLKDKRVNYVIWNRRIAYYGGAWQPYSGKNPHDKHMHVSIKESAANDSSEWNLKEEPMFNEGDRININRELYGKDLGLHKDLVGKKTFKEAIYAIFDKSKDYKDNAKVNDGDVVNYFRALVGREPSKDEKDALRGLPHKVMLYGMLDRGDVKNRMGSIGAVNVVEVPEGTLIKVKGE